MTDVVEKAWSAYQLRAKGMSWQEIAAELHYDSALQARRRVTQMLSAAAAGLDDERRSEMLELELARLDMMQSALWESALAGDVQSVNAVLKIMTHRANLAKLVGENTGGESRTVIIASENYVDHLKELAE